MNDFLHLLRTKLRYSVPASAFSLLFLLPLAFAAHISTNEANEFNGFFLFIAYLSALFNLSSFGIKANGVGFGSTFSLKYIHSLPRNKNFIILISVISDVVALLPFFITYAFILYLNPEYKASIASIELYSINLIVISTFAFFAYDFLIYKAAIEFPRKQHKVGFFKNILKFWLACSYLGIIVSLFSMIILFTEDKLLQNILLFLFSFSIATGGYFLCLYSFLNEKISYWNTKRDLPQLLILPVISSCIFVFGISLKIESKIPGALSKVDFFHRYLENYEKAFLITDDFITVINRKDNINLQQSVVKEEILAYKNSYGARALHIAVFHYDKDLIKYLLGIGVNPNQKMDFEKGGCLFSNLCKGITAIHLAVYLGQEEIYDMLVEAGADVNIISDDSQISPLRIAAAKCRYPFISKLIHDKANLNFSGRDQISPLLKSVAAGCETSAALLIHAGADKQQKDRSGKDALHYAEKSPYWKLVRFLRANNSFRNTASDNSGH